jgi:hypothetical protein
LVRHAAVQALAPLVVTDLAARATISAVVREDAGAGAHLAAVRALASVSEDRTVLALLLDRAHLAQNGAIRRAAIQALTQRVDEPAVRALMMDVARDDDESAVRCVAVQALGQRVADADIRALLESLARGPGDGHVRNAAWRVLACLPEFGPDDLPDAGDADVIP